MAKMTETEWLNMFDTKFEHEINKFRHSDKTLFGNDDITTELKFAVGTLIRNMFRVKMEFNQMQHCGNRTEVLRSRVLRRMHLHRSQAGSKVRLRPCP